MTSEQQRSTAHHLYQRWISMWNGDLRIAQEIIAARFKVHLSGDATAPRVEVNDPASVASWVAHIRSCAQRLSYHVILGPMVDKDKVIVHWQAVGCTKPAGGDAVQSFSRVGVDIIRFNRDRLEECWTLSNSAREVARQRI